MILFEAIHLAFIATFRKEPIVVQYMQFVVSFLQSATTREDEGQGMVEYGLIIALVALVAMAGLTILGNNVSGLLGGITF